MEVISTEALVLSPRTGYDPDKVAFDSINPAARPLYTDGIQKTASEEQVGTLPGNSWVQVLHRKKTQKKEVHDQREEDRGPTGRAAEVKKKETKRPFRLPSLKEFKHKIIVKPRKTAVDLKSCRDQIGEAVQNSLPRCLAENSIVRLLEEQNTIMICTDIWDEAEALAKLRSLIFPSGQLDVEAYHVSPREEACRGVIHGVRPELSNAQIREKIRAPGHEILDARRLGRSKSALITFAGTKVPFTVTFNWLETPCFLYKKTKAACLNCGEAGHRTDVCSKPTGYACAMCGAPQAMEGHPCVPKCALCGGAHKTYDSHCPEKFFKEKRQIERTGRSRSRHRNGEQQVRWLSKERSGSRPRARSRSRSASCKRNSSHPAPLAEKKRKRKSRKGGKKQNWNQRSMSRDGKNLDLGDQEKWPELQKNDNHINVTKNNPPPRSSGSSQHTQVLRHDAPSKGVEDVEMKSICSGTPGITTDQFREIVEAAVKQAVQSATQLLMEKITQLSNKVVALERNREFMLKQLGTSGKKSTFLERKRSSLLQELGAKRRSPTDARREVESVEDTNNHVSSKTIISENMAMELQGDGSEAGQSQPSVVA